MSETGGNNSNINQAVNNSPNSLQNSQNPETSNPYGNQSNNMNPYNSGSTYGSGYGGYNSGSGYGSGFGSSYGSGGYGSSYGSGYGSSYGSGYGSSYGSGGYGSSYGSGYGSSGYGSSYGSGGYGSNQYSNTYSKPMQQGQGQDQQNQQVPPPNLRHDVWGFLNGFHAILNVLYAGTGIVHFGKMFFKMSIKIIKAVFGKSAGLVYKLTGFQFLKNIMQKLSNKGDWLGEFNVGEAPLENLWSNNGPESANTNKTFFGKFMLVLRILALMGGIVSFFLRRKVSTSQNQEPPVQIEFMDHEIPQVQLRPDEPVVGIEGIKSFYDEVKLIEQDHAEELRDSVSMKEVIEEVNEEVKSELKSEVEIEEESPRSAIISEVEEKTLEKLNEDETNPIAVISSTEEEVAVTLAPEMPRQEIFVPQVLETQETVQIVPETITTQVTKEQIVSEDFWKNEEVFKKIESIQKENSQSEASYTPFELPSVLKTLRSSSSNATKPWLMKKKKNPEPAQEIPVQTLAESTTLPTETITPEMPISEVKKENSEVVEIPSIIDNPLEGTA